MNIKFDACCGTNSEKQLETIGCGFKLSTVFETEMINKEKLSRACGRFFSSDTGQIQHLYILIDILLVGTRNKNIRASSGLT